MKAFHLQKKKGFTLIETLVAITILMIAVVVPLTIVAGALQSSYYASDQITAVYLAQDAMEYIKNIRDSNALYNIRNAADNGVTQKTWLEGLELCDNSLFCQIDTVRPVGSGNIYQVPGTNDALPLYYDNSNHVYTQTDTLGNSRFTRWISMTPISSTEESITVHVNWNGSSLFSGRSFDVTELMYNAWAQ